MSHEQNPAQQAITGQFTLTAQLPQGKSFSVVGYLYDRESVESVNARVDLLHDVADRQRTRAEIPEIQAEINKALKMLEGNKAHYALLLDKKDRGAKLAIKEQEMLNQMDVNNRLFMENIDKGRQRLAEMCAKVGVPVPQD